MTFKSKLEARTFKTLYTICKYHTQYHTYVSQCIIILPDFKGAVSDSSAGVNIYKAVARHAQRVRSLALAPSVFHFYCADSNEVLLTGNCVWTNSLRLGVYLFACVRCTWQRLVHWITYRRSSPRSCSVPQAGCHCATPYRNPNTKCNTANWGVKYATINLCTLIHT
jgi:hypothetical protein